MTKYVAEYYVGSYNMIGLFEAKNEQEVRDYLIKKYGEIVKISQIVKLADQSASIPEKGKNASQATKLDKFVENKDGEKA